MTHPRHPTAPPFRLPDIAALPSWRAPRASHVRDVVARLQSFLLDGTLLSDALRSTQPRALAPSWEYGRTDSLAQRALAPLGCRAAYFGNFRVGLVFDRWVLKAPVVPAFQLQNDADWRVYRGLPRAVRDAIFPRTRRTPEGFLVLERCTPGVDGAWRAAPEEYLRWAGDAYGFFCDYSDQNVGQRGNHWVWLDWTPEADLEALWNLHRTLRDLHLAADTEPFPVPAWAMSLDAWNAAMAASARVTPAPM